MNWLGRLSLDALPLYSPIAAIGAGVEVLAGVAIVLLIWRKGGWPRLWRDWLTKELRALGVDTPDSFANFVLPDFGVSGPTSAAAVDGYLRARGVIVRRMESYGLPGRLRITVGSPSDNQTVAAALKEFLSEGGREGADRAS